MATDVARSAMASGKYRLTTSARRACVLAMRIPRARGLRRCKLLHALAVVGHL